MGTLKIIILLSCTSACFASHHSHVIPVEGYETELQDLGEHVITPEAPVKVIKITKTVAVKIPVPYPVKIVEKVPYPVHIAKPYPVPVPQIVKIPHPVIAKGSHDQHGDGHPAEENSYDVHENHEAPNAKEYYVSAENESHGGNNYDSYQPTSFSNGYASEGGPGHSYGPPEGHGGGHSFESRSYDEAIQKYLDENQPSSHGEGSSQHY